VKKGECTVKKVAKFVVKAAVGFTLVKLGVPFLFELFSTLGGGLGGF